MAHDVGKSTLVLLLTIGLLAGIAVWSFFYRSAAQSRLTTSSNNLEACQQAAAWILSLRQQKQRALLQTKPQDELNRKVDAWARQVGIDTKLLARIEPQEPRRVRDSQYLEQVTTLELYQVTLPQLIQLAQLAEQSEEGLQLTSMRISPPRIASNGSVETETWNAELALTYLIYSPRSGRP